METKEYRIHGTGVSFTSKPEEFDLKALERLAQINSPGLGPEEVCVSDLRYKDPQKMPEDLFLCRDSGVSGDIGFSFLRCALPFDQPEFKPEGEWKYSGHLGVMGSSDLTFQGIKQCYVYHEGNRKTDWFMIVYSLIHKNSYMKLGEVRLCHVFQSDDYALLPDKRIYYIAAGFEENEVDARMAELGAELGSVLEGPMNQLRDCLELDGRQRVVEAVIANGNKRKRSQVWEDFTEIQVRGLNGVVVANLAICNRCSTVYTTRSLVKNKQGGYDLKNHGTNTLKNHKEKCIGQQHHVAGKNAP